MIEADAVSVGSDDFDNLSVFDYVDNFGLMASAVPIDNDSLSGYPVSALAELVADDRIENNDGDANHKRKALLLDNAQAVQPYKLQRPRILKRDFRRHLPVLWANVFNSTDRDLMMQFLRDYYDPNVDLWQRDIRGVRLQESHKLPHAVRHLQGVDILAHFWYDVMTAAPDLVCTLKHTCVKIRTDGTSLIQCCFTLTGTKILPAPDPSDEKTMQKLAYYQSLIALDRAKISPSAAAMAAVAPEQAAAMLYAQRIAELGQSDQIRASASSLALPAVAVAASASPEDAGRTEDEDSVASADASLLDRYVVLDSASEHSSSSYSSTLEVVVATAAASDSVVMGYGGTDSTAVTTSSATSSSGYSSCANLTTSITAAITATTNAAAGGPAQQKRKGRSRQSPPNAGKDESQGEEHVLRRYLRAAALVKERRRARRRKEPTVTDQWLSVAQEAFRINDTVAVAQPVDGGGGGGYRYTGMALADTPDAPTPRCLALAGGIDCVCSIDMHLSADNRVVAHMLHYIT